MAKVLKSNIYFDPMVESINRKFTQKKNKCSAPTTTGPVQVGGVRYMGGATRTTNRGGFGTCKKNYAFFRDGYRQSPVLAEETARRMLFAQAVAGRNHIKRDLSQVTRVAEMIVEALNDLTLTVNGISMRGYTPWGWVMAVQYAGKKASASYDVNTFPTAFDA